MSEASPRLSRGSIWRGREIKYLRRNASLGAAALARDLGRSVASVKGAARRLRISLRRKGERRGLVMGQPRDLGLSGELRDAAIRRRVSEAAIAARRELEAPPVCPVCGLRDATHHSGYCVACWRHELTKSHRRELERLRAEDDSQRDLWQARQELHRARMDDAEPDREHGAREA